MRYNQKIVRKIQNVRLSKIVWKRPAKYQIPVIENSKKKRINIENKELNSKPVFLVIYFFHSCKCKELHSCCKTLGVNIECWGICMGDCNESQEVDPIFFMTSCGSFLRDVAVKCCKKVKTSKIRTKGIIQLYLFNRNIHPSRKMLKYCLP